MARHDREESLEEQLAWLDAIKEQEEAPPGAVTDTAMDGAAISPYPKDPWGSVPSEPSGISSPLFRTAVDSAHDPAGASTVVPDASAEDADAGDWLEGADTVSAFTLPALPVPSAQDDDGFLAPLKPLPRQEHGDTGGHPTGEFPDHETRVSRTESEPEPSRGLFEQPQRTEKTAESAVPALEPFKPSAPEAGKPAAGGADSDHDQFTLTGIGVDRFAFDNADSDRDRSALPSTGTDSDRSALPGTDSDRDRSALPDTGADSGRSVLPSTGADRDGFTSDAADREDDRSGSHDTGPKHDLPVLKNAEPFIVSESLRPAPELPEPELSKPEPAEPFRVPESFGAERPVPAEHVSGPFGADTSGSSAFAQDRDRDRDKPTALERETSPFSEWGKPFTSERETAFESRGDTAFAPDRDTPFGAGRDKPFTPERETAFTSEQGGSFTPDRHIPEAPSRSRAFAADLDRSPSAGGNTSFESSQEATPSRDTAFSADRDTSPALSRDAAFAAEQVAPSASGRETAEPVREPYQARRRQSPSPPAFSAPARQSVPGAPRPSADSLDPESLLRGRRNGPSGGWRKLIYKASAGLIKPGESPEVRRRRELVGRARTPVATGHHRVAVLSLKGGVGKTTTTVGLGATLAQIRGDRVIAVDANPDRGTLSDKLELETSATVRDLLNERQQIKRYVDIRAFTSQAPSRLEILASDRDPSVSEAFSASDYQSVAQVLENFYSICITDCGTGLLHSAMSGVLGLADQLVLVSSPSVDGARAASATLDWLEAHHYEELVRSATVVLCSVRPRSKSTVDLDRLEAHFAARCRAVIRVPYDPHLEEGAEIDLERLQPGTRESYLRLAASVGDGFAGTQL